MYSQPNAYMRTYTVSQKCYRFGML